MQTVWKQLKALAVKPVWAEWLLIILALVLRLRQYIANRSFWVDEANLALNIVDRTFRGLTQPLDYEQGAPIGFLFIEKAIITVLSNQDYILRLFPLISGILVCFLFYLIIKSLLNSKAAVFFALFVLAISWPLIYYSSELKQYSSDAMISLLLIYLSLRCFGDQTRLRDFILLGAVGFVAIWTSHPSAFVLAGIGVALAFDRFTKKAYTSLAWTTGLGVAWLASLGTEYLVSLRYLVGNDYLRNYWEHGFMPLPPWSDPGWFLQSYLSLLITVSPSLDRWYLASICSLLIVAGIISFFLRDRIIGLLTFLPFVMITFASALQRYPLRGRFMLFLVPFAILLMAEGLGRIFSLLDKWNRIPAVVVSAVLVVTLLWVPISGIATKFLTPPKRQDIKPVMQYVMQNRKEGDIVYVYHGARPAFNYYAPFYGLDQGNIIAGQDLPDHPALKQFFNDIDQLRGKGRVWIIFTNIVDCGGCKGDMETYYVQYINQYGSAVDKFQAIDADVYLYNLTAQ